MQKCLICKKTRFPICTSCAKDPFLVEDCRKELANLDELETLRTMYSKSYREIDNLNTANFWDEKLDAISLLKSEDGMTQDRIKATAAFIPESARNILDLGIGYGYLEETLERQNRKLDIHGIDISPHGIKVLKKRFKGTFTVGELEKIKYLDNHFDVVCTLELLEHIPPHKLFSLLNEIHRVLKPGGAFLISIPMNEDLRHMKDNPSGHTRDYTPKLLFSELKLASFQVDQYKQFYAFSSNYRFKKILQKIFWFKWKPNDLVVRAIKV